MADIRVPTLGESVTEATVGKWFKQPGDAVAVDEPLVELETDKVTLEVPAPAAGVLSARSRPRTATPSRVGALLGQIKEGAGAAPQSRCRRPPSRPKRRSRRLRAPRKACRNAGCRRRCAKWRRKAASTRRRSPAPACTARSPKATCWRRSSAPPAQPTPVAAAAVQMRAPSPADDAAREERVHMTRLRQTIARRLKDAQNTAAMLTTFNEVDMSAVMRLRNQYKDLFEKKHGVKLGFMGFFVRACIQALEGNPRGQCRDRRHRHRLQELLSHRRRGRHRARAWWCRWCATPITCRSPASRRPSPISASARATARSRSRRCRAAPSPSPTAASTAR